MNALTKFDYNWIRGCLDWKLYCEVQGMKVKQISLAEQNVTAAFQGGLQV